MISIFFPHLPMDDRQFGYIKKNPLENTNKQSNNQGRFFKIQFSNIQKLLNFSQNVAKFVVKYTLPRKKNLQISFVKNMTNFVKKKKQRQQHQQQHWGRTTKFVKQCGVLLQLSDTPCEKSTTQKHKVCPYISCRPHADSTLGKMFVPSQKRLDQMKWMPVMHASVFVSFQAN